MSFFRPPAVAALLLALAVVRAEAHPHVFVDAKTELVFDQTGRMEAIRNIWQFDEAFSAYAVEGLDADSDGKLSDAELKPLADVNVKSLKEFELGSVGPIDLRSESAASGERVPLVLPPKSL